MVTGRLDLPSFVSHLAAADVVLALRFPSHGEISGALVRALGLGRAAIVTGGTPAAEEFPEGVVVPVDPGRGEEEEIQAFLERFRGDRPLLERIERAARSYVERHHGLAETASELSAFLSRVASERERLAASLALRRAPEGSLLAYLLDEVRRAAHDLGLQGLPLGHEALLEDLVP